ncbi:MAG: triose-phosphate isomerase [Acidobacteriota bacterium]
MKRKPIIAGNWKMYKLSGESLATAIELKPLVSNANHCEVVIAPPFTAIKVVADRLEGSSISLAGQNLSGETKQGPHTGEICGDMLRDAGCSHVLVGHSERRQFYGDTNTEVNRKTRAALSFGLRPIVCVGEMLEERDGGKAEDVVRDQLYLGLAELTGDDLLRIIIAYEPVWAIGTGRTATPQIAQSMHGFIRGCLEERFGLEASQATRILYGGSVKPENIATLMLEADIDGALVGGASLEAQSFARIVHYNR